MKSLNVTQLNELGRCLVRPCAAVYYALQLCFTRWLVLTFKSVNENLNETWLLCSTFLCCCLLWRHIIMLYKVVLTFESVYEIL